MLRLIDLTQDTGRDCHPQGCMRCRYYLRAMGSCNSVCEGTGNRPAVVTQHHSGRRVPLKYSLDYYDNPTGDGLDL